MPRRPVEVARRRMKYGPAGYWSCEEVNDNGTRSLERVGRSVVVRTFLAVAADAGVMINL